MASALELLLEIKLDDTVINQADIATNRLSANFANADKSASDLNSEIKATNSANINAAETAASGLENELNNASNATNGLNEQLNNTNSEGAKLIGNVKKLVAGFISFQAVKKATETFIAFDDTMLKVKSLIGEVSESDFGNLESQAKQLGKTTAFSASEVAKAQANFAQSGFKVNEILDATPATLSLASAATLEMGRAAEIVSKSLSLFNLDAKESARVSDVIAKAQATSAADAEFLASALFNVGSASNSMGYELEDSVALIASISTGFDNGSSAGTALNATLRDMSKNSEGLKALGVETANADGSFRQLEDVMLDLKLATDSMTDSQKKQTLATIFGDEAQKAVNVLLAGGAEKTKEYDESLRNATGTAQEMSSIMESGLGGTFRSLLSATEGLAIEIGQFLAPAIDGLTTIITGTSIILSEVVGFMNSGSLTAEILTSAIYGIAAAFAIYKGVALASTIQTAILTSGLTLSAIASGGLTTALQLLNLSNPFGWIAIGITGLTLLYKKFEPFQNLVDGATSAMKRLFGFGKDDKDLVVDNVKEKTTSTMPGVELSKDEAQFLGMPGLDNQIANLNAINNDNKKSGDIIIPVSNNVDSEALAREIQRSTEETVKEYNRQQLAIIGG